MAKNKKNSRSMSRRDFMKGFGSGVVGGSIMLQTLHAAPPPTTGTFKDESNRVELTLKVNGKLVQTKITPHTTLIELIRDKLALTGTKVVCNHGECGACTVLLDGRAVYSCHMLALDAHGKEVITVEGLMQGEELHPLQEAFIEKDGMQCGFCTPGQIMAAQGLLNEHPHPNREQILKGMSGNICRCSAYPKIADSVVAAAKK
ncbi:MAG: 2Fe-2S iron-sulfur cluster binding domain-containing protein [Caldithrix sp.]|nr:2Fe-2S iron-sulfur cluster binding domain-containing protein [Caldithrix sp.]